MLKKYNLPHYIQTICWIYLITGVMGLLLTVLDYGAVHNSLLFLAKQLVPKASLSPLSMWRYLFLHNVVSDALTLPFVFLYSLIPLGGSIVNGLALGLVLGTGAVKLGAIKTLTLILPHGILEIPANILCQALGLQLGIAYYRDRKHVKDMARNALRVFVSIVLPLLFVAAFIESFVTPKLASLF